MDTHDYQHLKPLLRNDTPTPLYHQLFGLLKERIVSGEIGRGQRLPTEFELAELFAVSRITAKRAMDELAAAGLVRRHRGRGTFVIHSARNAPLEAPLYGLVEGLEVIARETSVEVISFSRRAAPRAVRELFAADETHLFAHALRIRRKHGEPFAHYQSWTDIHDPRFDGDALARQPRIHLFRQLGLTMVRVEQTLSAVAADATVASRLKVEAGAPLLSLDRRSYRSEGVLFDLLQVLYRPDRFRYHMTLSTDQD